MNEPPGTATIVANRVGSGAGRVLRAWRAMPREHRLAAYAAIGLFVAMFLPWYQRQFFMVLGHRIAPASDSQTAWGAFSFVEAAVLLVAAGVLTLLFRRAEGRAFHLPGGDGGVVMAAGVWTSILIVWRIFDKQGGAAHGQNATTYGIEWGIFVALAVAVLMAYAGSRIRAAHRPEPPLPWEEAARVPTDSPRPAATPAPPAAAAAADPDPASTSQTLPRRRPSPTRPPAERPVGWLTARPGHLRDEDEPPRPGRPREASPERPPRPVAAPPPPGDTAATLPARRDPPPDDTAATLPVRRDPPPRRTG